MPRSSTDWDLENDNRARGAGIDFQRPADFFCALSHRKHSVSFTGAFRIESAAVVGNRQFQETVTHHKIDCRSRAVRMTNSVVDAFFENQKDIAAHVRAERHILFSGGSA